MVELSIGRDSLGFEDIDEFWNADAAIHQRKVSDIPKSEKIKKGYQQSSGNRSSEGSSHADSFDYDTSDSISEEEESIEEEGDDNQSSEESKSTKNNSRRSSTNAKHSRNSNASNANKNKSTPKSSRVSSIGGESFESTLPLEDSYHEDLPPGLQENQRLSGGSTYDSLNLSAADIASRRNSSLPREGAQGRADHLHSDGESTDDMGKGRRRSLNSDDGENSTDDMAKGRRSNPSSDDGEKSTDDNDSIKDKDIKGRRSIVSSKRVSASPKKQQQEDEGVSGRDQDDAGSVDTVDMSAIPTSSPSKFENNDMDNGGDNMDFGDDFETSVDYGGMDEDVQESGSKGRLSSSRRVSFGAGTKPDEEEEEEEEKDARNKSKKSPLKEQAGTTTPVSRRYSIASSSGSGSTAGYYSMGTTPGSNEFARGKALPDESFRLEGEDEGEDELRNSDSDDEGGDDSGFVEDTSFLKAIKDRNLNDGDRRDSRASTDQEEEEEEEDEEAEEDRRNGMRRSSRITKGQRMAYWRGERPVYQKGKMVGILKADKTPAKKARPVAGKKRKLTSLERSGTKSDHTDSEDEENGKNRSKKGKNQKRGGKIVYDEEEGDIVLPTDFAYLEREIADELSVWDDPSDSAKTLKIVCHGESLRPPSALPITTDRPKGKDKVGYAAQSFNIPEVAGVMSGWISGFVELPPGSIKDAEGVGECSQVFFISECQADGVELGIADPREEEWKDNIAQRILLRKGDSFFVPPGNIYRLENHSTTTPCTLFWAIVKPMENAVYGGNNSQNEEEVNNLVIEAE
mmetsp:Transcript_18619/g.17945  ORF Transcript_18619/g.17945 Transcript_18619/m.17945 type:complete len:798 (+) Transcript_18619:113-2506(+)